MLFQKIKWLCEKKGVTIAALERELHIGNGNVARWDKNRPSIDKAKSVADYFGVSVDSLIDDAKDITEIVQ